MENLTEQEIVLLRELVEIALDETSPKPTETMRSLAVKIGLSYQTQEWINRNLNRG